MMGPIVPAGSAEPLDEDQVAAAPGMSQAYVNYLCWHLAAGAIIVRQRGSGGKLRIPVLDPDAARQAAHIAWQVIAAIKVSTSRTQIVAGSKMLHHLLPELIPPIDRQYTSSFFTGQKVVPDDRAAFLDWFPSLPVSARDARNRSATPLTAGASWPREKQSDRQRHHGLHAATATARVVAPSLTEGHLPPPDHLLAACKCLTQSHLPTPIPGHRPTTDRRIFVSAGPGRDA
jgi:hypothetical protein